MEVVNFYADKRTEFPEHNRDIRRKILMDAEASLKYDGEEFYLIFDLNFRCEKYSDDPDIMGEIVGLWWKNNENISRSWDYTITPDNARSVFDDIYNRVFESFKLWPDDLRNEFSYPLIDTFLHLEWYIDRRDNVAYECIGDFNDLSRIVCGLKEEDYKSIAEKFDDINNMMSQFVKERLMSKDVYGRHEC